MENQDHNVLRVIRKLLLYIREKEITTGKEEKEKLWNNIAVDVKKIRAKETKRRKIYIASSVAAIAVILILAISRYLSQSNENHSLSQLVHSNYNLHDTEEILLIVSQDKQVEVKDKSDITYAKDGSILIGSEDIDKIVDEDKKEKIEYNQLVVPKGKRTMIMLSDETRMWVNSGSRVIYPRSFTQKTRNVFVEGEVYLEVAHNEKQPFIVETKTFEVQVLGTSFGVCSYNGIETSSVVLVNGAVDVKDIHNNKSRLQPNQLITIDDSGLGQKKDVVAIDYISWTQGLFTLHAESFGMILNKLSQYYGVEINFDNIDKNIPITGKLVLKDDFEEVLDGLGAIVPITYTYHNGIYQIKIKD